MAIINKKNKSGITMVELLLVVSIISIVAASIAIPMRSSRQVWESGDRYAEVMQNALIGMDKITRELKYATQIIAFGSWEILPLGLSTDPPTFEGFVEFTDRLGTTQIFRYNATTLHDMPSSITTGDGNLMYGSPDSLSILTGPVSSLRFTCYQSDGSVPTTSPEKIAVIQIEMITRDSQGQVPDIPLTSKVRVRMDKGDDVMDITDYCMYGKAGVTIKNNAEVTSLDPVNTPANVGALQNLITELNNVIIHGSVVAGGSLNMANGSIVATDVFVRNTVNISGSIDGNVNCNGTVNWSGVASQIDGYMNLAPGAVANPSTFPADRLVSGGVPPLKFYNPMPPATIYPAGTSTDDRGAGSLAPGYYRDIDLGNGGSLILSSGQYFVRSLKGTNNCNITYNLSAPPHTVQVFITDNIDFGSNTTTSIINGEYGNNRDASKIYFELHGNGTGNNAALKWGGDWVGTAFTPNGDINCVNFTLTGAYYCGGMLSLEHPNTALMFVPAVPSILPWINPIN